MTIVNREVLEGLRYRALLEEMGLGDEPSMDTELSDPSPPASR